MGNSSKSPQHFHIQSWIQCSQPERSLFHQVNTFRTKLLFNPITQHYIQEYILQFTSWEEYQDYLREIEWRRQGSTLTPPIQVHPVKYFRDCSSSELCSTIYSGAVYFERIEMRLKEINDIPFLDALYVMRTCLQGFGTLYKRFGTFDVREEMVFISEAGTTKVWLNSNLSSNIPLHRDSSQTTMVTVIITMIQSNIDPQYQSLEYFSDYLKKNEQLDDMSFDEALHQLNTFCDDRNIIIPAFMKSVADLYSGKASGVTEQFMAENSELKMRKSYRGESVRKEEFGGKTRVPHDQYQFVKNRQKLNHLSTEKGHKRHRTQGNQADSSFSIRKRMSRSRPTEGKKPLTENARIRGKFQGSVVSQHFRSENMTQQGGYSTKRRLHNKYFSSFQAPQKQAAFIESSTLTASKKLYSVEPRSVFPVPIHQTNQLSYQDAFKNSLVRFNYLPKNESQLNSSREFTPSKISSKNRSVTIYEKKIFDTSFKRQNIADIQSKVTNITQRTQGAHKIEENFNKYYQLDPVIAADLKKIIKEEKM